MIRHLTFMSVHLLFSSYIFFRQNPSWQCLSFVHSCCHYIGNVESQVLGLNICCLLLPGNPSDEPLDGYPFALICRLPWTLRTPSLQKRKLRDVGYWKAPIYIIKVSLLIPWGGKYCKRKSGSYLKHCMLGTQIFVVF